VRPSSKLGAITACSLWASAFVGVKFGLGFLPMFTFAGLRFLLAGLMQTPFVAGGELRRGGNPFSPARLLLRPHTWLVSLCNTFLLYAAFFYGLTLVRGAQAAIVIGASPVVVAWMAHWWMPDDKMTPRKNVAFLLGLLGVAVIAIGSELSKPDGKPEQFGMLAGRAELFGMLVLLCVSFISGLGNILVARTPESTRPVELNCMQMLLGGAGLFAVGWLVEGPQDLLTLPTAFWGTLVYLAFLSAAAFAIWFSLLQREKVSALNLWKFLVPVLGAAFAWILLPNESPDVASVVGMVLVASGIFFGSQNGEGRHVSTY